MAVHGSETGPGSPERGSRSRMPVSTTSGLGGHG
jgi:hypothetical protein